MNKTNISNNTNYITPITTNNNTNTPNNSTKFALISIGNSLLLQQQGVQPFLWRQNLRIPPGPQKGLPSSALVIGDIFLVKIGDFDNFVITSPLIKFNTSSAIY